MTNIPTPIYLEHEINEFESSRKLSCRIPCSKDDVDHGNCTCKLVRDEREAAGHGIILSQVPEYWEKDGLEYKCINGKTFVWIDRDKYWAHV